MVYIKRFLLLLSVISIIIIFIFRNFSSLYKISLKAELIISKKFNPILTYSKVNTHLLTIEIPKISLKRKVYNLNTPENNVDANIEIISSSKLKYNNIILASHSGNSKNAYFTKIKNLILNDKIFIYYQNKKYKYIVSDKKYIKKTGYLKINEYMPDTLILITCSLKERDKQLIIYANLTNISEYK